MSKELEAFELLCRFLVEEINTLRHKDLNEDYFYNKKYGVTMTDKKTGITYTIADIADALKNYEELKKLKLLPYPKVNDEEYRRSVIKSLQALEIIKELFEVWEDNGTYHLRPLYDIVRLKKEDYDLLKEVL